jgi:DNA-binding CsgD family transcriptional regulator/pimeloyl-ACP methyl ester carboxylesterase
MTSPVSPQTFDRVLKFLDALYAAAESDQPYGDFVHASDLFFFSQTDQRALLEDTPASLEALNGFRRHVERIEKIAEISYEPSDASGDLDSALACFVINAQNKQVTGNATASHLMDRQLPCDLSALPLSDESMTLARQLLSDVRDGSFQGIQTLPLSFEHRGEVLVARAIKMGGFAAHDQDAPTLQFTVSYVMWTRQILSFAITEFDLTEAEVEVLQQLLQGASQAEAAQCLGKSKETVKAQAKSILRKFRATQMVEVQTIARAYAFLGQHTRVDRLKAPRPIDKAVSGSRMVDVGQLRSVEVWEYGAVDGFPVLFWHALILGPFFSPRMVAAFQKANLRVICVSRPGFGRSSPPLRWEGYNATVTADAVSVVDQLGLSTMAFWVHQGGISFACRAAEKLSGRVLGASMNGAGIPIQPHMLSKMNKTTRVAAATVMHAPKLLEMMLRYGFKLWRMAGPKQFFRQFFGADGVEQQALQDPEYAPLFELSFLHSSAQVPDAIIWDGKAAMQNWHDAYRHFDFPQQWLHGDRDQILDAGYVAEFLIEEDQAPLIMFEGYGTDLLYRGFDKVFPPTLQFFRSLNPKG